MSGGAVSGALDLCFLGHWFDFRSGTDSQRPRASCWHACASVTKQYDLVLVKRWCSVAGKGLAENNGSLLLGLWLTAPQGWLSKSPGSAPASVQSSDKYGTSVTTLECQQPLLNFNVGSWPGLLGGHISFVQYVYLECITYIDHCCLSVHSLVLTKAFY